MTRLRQFGSMFQVFAFALALAIGSLALGASSFAAEAAQGGDVVVTGVKGDVNVTMRGRPRLVKPGTVMELAASVRTGANSSLQLRQGNTTFSVASDSVVELPAGATAGDPIDRVMQTRGNVLYDVGKRGVRKLRVETPYLVAVIKGTQFNVAVQDDSSVISLFEGLLEIHASDGSDTVDLKAGEIAIRGRADRTIRVIRMDTGEPVARAETRHAPVGSGSGDGRGGTPDTTRAGSPVETELARVAPVTSDGRTLRANGSVAVSSDTGTLNVSAKSATGLTADLDLQAVDKSVLSVGLDTSVDTGAVNVSPGTGLDVAGAASVDVGADVGVDPGSGAVDVGASAGVDLGAASVDLGVGAGVDLGSGTVGVDVGAGVDLGAAAVDVGVDAGVDLGAGTVDLGLDAGVDAGGTAVDLGASVGADLGSGSVDLGLDAGVDTGSTPVVDLGLDAGVDAGAGAVDLGVDAGVAGVDAGIDAGVDLSAGTVGTDASVGDLDLGLDVDLGSGTVDLGVGTVTPTVPPSSGSSPPSSGGGGLLGGVGGAVGGLLGGGN